MIFKLETTSHDVDVESLACKTAGLKNAEI